MPYFVQCNVLYNATLQQQPMPQPQFGVEMSFLAGIEHVKVKSSTEKLSTRICFRTVISVKNDFHAVPVHTFNITVLHEDSSAAATPAG